MVCRAMLCQSIKVSMQTWMAEIPVPVNVECQGDTTSVLQFSRVVFLLVYLMRLKEIVLVI